MPIKPEEALEVIGLSADKYDSVDDFKEAVEAKFVSLDAAHTNPAVTAKVLGKFNYVVRRKVEKIAKEFDVELPKDAEALDLIDTIAEPVIGVKGQLKEWKEKAEKSVPDDVLKEWQGKLTKAEKERDTFASQAKEFGEKYNNLQNEIVTTKRKNTIESAWSGALNGVTFHSGVDDLRKEGFVAKVKSMYKVEVDEDGKVSLQDDKGNPVKHPKRAGELLTLDEAVKLQAAAFKLLNDNPHANKPVTPPTPRFAPPTPPAGGAPPPGQRPVRQPAKRWGMA